MEAEEEESADDEVTDLPITAARFSQHRSSHADGVAVSFLFYFLI